MGPKKQTPRSSRSPSPASPLLPSSPQLPPSPLPSTSPISDEGKSNKDNANNNNKNGGGLLAWFTGAGNKGNNNNNNSNNGNNTKNAGPSSGLDVPHTKQRRPSYLKRAQAGGTDHPMTSNTAVQLTRKAKVRMEVDKEIMTDIVYFPTWGAYGPYRHALIHNVYAPGSKVILSIGALNQRVIGIEKDPRDAQNGHADRAHILTKKVERIPLSWIEANVKQGVAKEYAGDAAGERMALFDQWKYYVLERVPSLHSLYYEAHVTAHHFMKEDGKYDEAIALLEKYWHAFKNGIVAYLIARCFVRKSNREGVSSRDQDKYVDKAVQWLELAVQNSWGGETADLNEFKKQEWTAQSKIKEALGRITEKALAARAQRTAAMDADVKWWQDIAQIRSKDDDDHTLERKKDAAYADTSFFLTRAPTDEAVKDVKEIPLYYNFFIAEKNLLITVHPDTTRPRVMRVLECTRVDLLFENEDAADTPGVYATAQELSVDLSKRWVKAVQEDWSQRSPSEEDRGIPFQRGWDIIVDDMPSPESILTFLRDESVQAVAARTFPAALVFLTRVFELHPDPMDALLLAAVHLKAFLKRQADAHRDIASVPGEEIVHDVDVADSLRVLTRAVRWGLGKTSAHIDILESREPAFQALMGLDAYKQLRKLMAEAHPYQRRGEKEGAAGGKETAPDSEVQVKYWVSRRRRAASATNDRVHNLYCVNDKIHIVIAFTQYQILSVTDNVTTPVLNYTVNFGVLVPERQVAKAPSQTIKISRAWLNDCVHAWKTKPSSSKDVTMPTEVKDGWQHVLTLVPKLFENLVKHADRAVKEGHLKDALEDYFAYQTEFRDREVFYKIAATYARLALASHSKATKAATPTSETSEDDVSSETSTVNEEEALRYLQLAKEAGHFRTKPDIQRLTLEEIWTEFRLQKELKAFIDTLTLDKMPRVSSKDKRVDAVYYLTPGVVRGLRNDETTMSIPCVYKNIFVPEHKVILTLVQVPSHDNHRLLKVAAAESADNYIEDIYDIDKVNPVHMDRVTVPQSWIQQMVRIWVYRTRAEDERGIPVATSYIPTAHLPTSDDVMRSVHADARRLHTNKTATTDYTGIMKMFRALWLVLETPETAYGVAYSLALRAGDPSLPATVRESDIDTMFAYLDEAKRKAIEQRKGSVSAGMPTWVRRRPSSQAGSKNHVVYFVTRENYGKYVYHRTHNFYHADSGVVVSLPYQTDLDTTATTTGKNGKGNSNSNSNSSSSSSVSEDDKITVRKVTKAPSYSYKSLRNQELVAPKYDLYDAVVVEFIRTCEKESAASHSGASSPVMTASRKGFKNVHELLPPWNLMFKQSLQDAERAFDEAKTSREGGASPAASKWLDMAKLYRVYLQEYGHIESAYKIAICVALHHSQKDPQRPWEWLDKATDLASIVGRRPSLLDRTANKQTTMSLIEERPNAASSASRRQQGPATGEIVDYYAPTDKGHEVLMRIRDGILLSVEYVQPHQRSDTFTARYVKTYWFKKVLEFWKHRSESEDSMGIDLGEYLKYMSATDTKDLVKDASEASLDDVTSSDDDDAKKTKTDSKEKAANGNCVIA